MNTDKTYQTPSLRVIHLDSEQMFALSQVDPGSGASAGGTIMQYGVTDQNANPTPTIWI